MITSEKMINNYNFISCEYEKRYYVGEDPNNRKISDLLRKIIIEREIKSVVECGCGTGYWIKEVDELGVRRILGIDGSERMLDIAKRKKYKNEVEFLLHDLTKEKNFDKKFDLVMTLFFISSLAEIELVRFINKMYQCVANGGCFLCIDNKIPQNIKQDTYELVLREKWAEKDLECHYNLYSEKKIQRLFENNGFKLLENMDIGEDIYGMVFGKL